MAYKKIRRENAMINVFKEVEKNLVILDELRILAQTGYIMYRQKGESHTAERFKKLEDKLLEAISLIKEGL